MKRRTKAQWQALIEEQVQSGLTAVAFCRQRGINDKYFSLRKQSLLKIESKAEGFAVARITAGASTIEVKTGHATISLPASQPAAWLADFVTNYRTGTAKKLLVGIYWQVHACGFEEP